MLIYQKCLTMVALICSHQSSITNRPIDTLLSKNDNCGVLALYMLLRLENHQVHMPELIKLLPNPTDRGYSMAQLSKAAKLFGMDLTGIKLSDSHAVIDRPLLVLLNDIDGGHFVVIRPVGTSGLYSQILDSSKNPEIGRTYDLIRSRSWSGFALSPSKKPITNYNKISILLLFVALTFLIPRTIARLSRIVRR